MEIGNMPSKIEANADKLGLIVGTIGELNRFGKEWAGYGGQGPFGAAMNIFQSLMQDPHIPDLNHVWQSLLNEKGVFKPAVIAAIIGWFAKEVDIVP